MTRMQFLAIGQLKYINPKVFDISINQFDSVLVKTGVYEKYRHLNPSYLKFKDGDWLTPLSKRWDSAEWMYYMNWLDAILLDIAKDQKELADMLPYERAT